MNIHISHFNDMRADPRVKFKTEIVDGQEFTIVCYTVADSKFWSSYPYAIEARGIVFDKDGNCVSRPLHKFFNVNEREETLAENLDFNYAKFFEKRDGSMIHPVIVGDKIRFKSKKTFFSDVAIASLKHASQELIDFCWEMLNSGYTPIFEYTDKNHQIVINYGETPKLTLIAIRHIQNGFYLNYNEMAFYSKKYKIPLIEKYDIDDEQAFNDVETKKNFEGYIVHTIDGTIVKLKTKWYLANHRVMTCLRERDIMNSFYDETLDDMKSFVVGEGYDIKPILEVEDRITQEIVEIATKTNELVGLIRKEPTIKDAALKYSNHEYFGLSIAFVKGKSPDVRKFWYNKMKSTYSLRVIYNPKFKDEN